MAHPLDKERVLCTKLWEFLAFQIQIAPVSEAPHSERRQIIFVNFVIKRQYARAGLPERLLNSVGRCAVVASRSRARQLNISDTCGLPRRHISALLLLKVFS